MRKEAATCQALQVAEGAFPCAVMENERWWSALTRSARQWFARLRCRHAVRRKVGKLAACDDRLLADVGISRAAVDNVASHGRHEGWSDVRTALPFSMIEAALR